MSTQWANIGEDAGALHALLQRIPEQVPLELIDYIWIFPARRVAAGESVVVVVGAVDADAERRRVITARFTVSRDRKGTARVNPRFDEHGTAPVAAVARIVQGVLRRLGEDVEAEPRAEQISGEQERWDALIVELGGRPRTPEAPTSPEATAAPAEGAGADGSEAAPPVSEADARATAPAADPAAAAETGGAAGDAAAHDDAVERSGSGTEAGS